MAPAPETELIFIVEPSSLRHEPIGFWQVGVTRAVSAHEGDVSVPKTASAARVLFILVSFRVIVRIPHMGSTTLW